LMHRILISFSLSGQKIEIMSYSFFLLVGIACVIVLGTLIAVKRGLPLKKALTCILMMGTALIAGSRILYVLNHLNLYTKNPALVFEIQLSRFSLYGGLVLALLSGILSCRLLKVDIWRLVDSLAPALGLGIAFVRIGCFLNGCCFGKCTTVPWAISFPFESSAYNYQLTQAMSIKGIGALFSPLPGLHPTQLYELAAALIGSLLATIVLQKKQNDGMAFLVFAIWFTAFRWFNNGLRADGINGVVPSWQYNLMYSSLIVCGFLALAVRKVRARTEPLPDARHET
jgi:phosphatidylglycerol---prolipoprotein diacylglyceryl transferase